MIKKVSDVTPTLNVSTVQNTKTSSNVDTYSCNYLNGTILYESTSGTTGNITLNDSLDNYATIRIYTMENDNNNRSLGVYEFDVNKTKYTLSSSSVSSSSFNVYTKEYTKGTNQLTSSTGKLYSGSSGSVSNYDVFKVYKVIGYK